MNPLNLNALYRDTTRGLPQHADLRLGADEVLALTRGESLGARHAAALAGLAGTASSVSGGMAGASPLVLFPKVRRTPCRNGLRQRAIVREKPVVIMPQR